MIEIRVISPEDKSYPQSRLAHWFPTLPDLHVLGHLDLLRMPLTALFCSRKCPGDAVLQAYDLARALREKETPVISGFHTPVEKDMLEILLKGKGPVVICPARGLEGMRIPKAWSQAIQQGRMLMVSMFDQRISRVTKESAYQRNRLVAALAAEHIWIHLEPGGQTEKLAVMFHQRPS